MAKEINKNARRLIYVDASGGTDNKKFNISLFDPDRNTTLNIELKKIIDNNIAEKYAVCYALLYIIKYNYSSCHILCDNKSAVNDCNIKNFANSYNIGLSWIPREANLIADKISKLDSKSKDEEWNLLKCFVEMSAKIDFNDNSIEKSNEMQKLKQLIITKDEKIKNQAKQLTNLKLKIEKKK